jgi:hypothetical protein
MDMQGTMENQNRGNGWEEYRRLVIDTQARHESEINCLAEKVEGYFREIISKVTSFENRFSVHLAEQRTQQRIRATAWGLGGGLFVTIVGLLVQHWLLR